ncbi:MAG: VanW family protein [Oscillospiraceae bacterium]|jgi:vancomycin resistance protein YoaR|nr:VanW family protein [Oscillospiraceae bacterium]
MGPYTRSYPTAIRPRRKSRRWRHFGKFILILLVVLAALGGAAAFAVNNALQPFSDRFHEGVYVDGLALAGMSPLEAYTLVNARAEERLGRWSLAVTYHGGGDGGEAWTLTPQTLEMQVDTADQVNRAYMRGRQGSLLARLLDIWKLRAEPYEGSTAFYFNEFSLDAALAGIKALIDVDPVDATREPDPNRTPPYRYTDEATGLSLDTDAIRGELLLRIASLDSTPFALAPDAVQPAVTKADLVNDNARLSRAATRIATTSTAERAANVALGCERFNGLVAQPGQEVSFNDVTGKRTLENGFMEALEIVYGEYVMGVGGGICQVSSTLYNAVVEAGLEVVDRTAHALPVSYLDPGKDATVADRGTDFVFRNNFDQPVTISARVEKIQNVEHCVFEIFGKPQPNGNTYAFVSEIVETIPIPEPKMVPDRKGEYVTYTNQTKQTSKGAVGYVANTFRITQHNGQEIARDFIIQDTYKAQPPIIYVGVTARE